MLCKMSDKEKIVEVARMLFENPEKYFWATRMFKILFDGNHVYTRGEVNVHATGCYMGSCTHCNLSSDQCLCPRVCKCFECVDYQKKCGDYVGDVVRYACANFQPDPFTSK